MSSGLAPGLKASDRLKQLSVTTKCGPDAFCKGRGNDDTRQRLAANDRQRILEEGHTGCSPEHGQSMRAAQSIRAAVAHQPVKRLGPKKTLEVALFSQFVRRPHQLEDSAGNGEGRAAGVQQDPIGVYAN
jgi:hypothetical protein